MRCSQARNAASWPGLTRDEIAAETGAGRTPVALSRTKCTIGAGVGNDPDLDRRERAVASCAEPHLGGHLVSRCGANELLLARKFPLHRPPGLQRGEHAEIFGQHLLLAAKSAADPLRKHAHVARADRRYGKASAAR